MDKYVPFGGPLHIVDADVKHFGSPDCVDVVFPKREDLAKLIQSLQFLHDNWDHPQGHFHLCDAGLCTHGAPRDPAGVEIMFSNQAWAETNAETRADLVGDSRLELLQFRNCRKGR